MKKETKMKNHIINWFITFVFAGLISLFCFAQNEIKQANAEDETPSFSISANDLNNKQYQVLGKYLANNYMAHNFSNTYLKYNDYQLNLHSVNDLSLKYVYSNQDNTDIIFIEFDYNIVNPTYKFTIFRSEYIDFEYQVDFYNLDFLKPYINPTFSLTSSELNNQKYSYLANYLNENYATIDLSNSYLLYNNNVYTFDNLSANDSIMYTETSNNYIYFILENINYANFKLFILDIETLFNSQLYFYNADILYQHLEAPYSPQGMSNALTDFISLLVNGISDLASGVASGVAGMAKQLFLEVDVSTGAVTGLSTFGGIVAIFAGIALAVGITTRVYTWVTSLGN